MNINGRDGFLRRLLGLVIFGLLLHISGQRETTCRIMGSGRGKSECGGD
jgi:hypothetical protein